MVGKVGFGLLFLIVAVYGQHDHDHDHHSHGKVNVDVYYESLCPDSKKFITTQLYPAMKTELGHYINLTLVPYGKSTSKFDVSNYEFTCHHGPNECMGNKIHACALRKITPMAEPGQGVSLNTLAFINCLMDKVPKDGSFFPTKECAELNNIGNHDDVEMCSNHTDGSNYLATLGQKTDQLQKPLQSVPTIVFNGQYKKEDSSMAQTDLVKVVCQNLQGTKPKICMGTSGAKNLEISFGFVVFLSVVSKFFH